MKTFKNKAKTLVEKFYDNTHALSMDGNFAEELVEIIRMGLKNQDRDTRHACAEAVIACRHVHHVGNDVITKNNAHSACVNVVAG